MDVKSFSKLSLKARDLAKNFIIRNGYNPERIDIKEFAKGDAECSFVVSVECEACPDECDALVYASLSPELKRTLFSDTKDVRIIFGETHRVSSVDVV